MSTELQEDRAIEAAVTKIELIEGLQAAIDRKYRRLLQAARADWERLFAGNELSNACVSVRVTGEEIQQPRTRAIPGSGFLKSRKPSATKERTKRSLPRFAH